MLQGLFQTVVALGLGRLTSMVNGNAKLCRLSTDTLQREWKVSLKVYILRALDWLTGIVLVTQEVLMVVEIQPLCHVHPLPSVGTKLMKYKDCGVSPVTLLRSSIKRNHHGMSNHVSWEHNDFSNDFFMLIISSLISLLYCFNLLEKAWLISTFFVKTGMDGNLVMM